MYCGPTHSRRCRPGLFFARACALLLGVFSGHGVQRWTRTGRKTGSATRRRAAAVSGTPIEPGGRRETHPRPDGLIYMFPACVVVWPWCRSRGNIGWLLRWPMRDGRTGGGTRCHRRRRERDVRNERGAGRRQPGFIHSRNHASSRTYSLFFSVLVRIQCVSFVCLSAV